MFKKIREEKLETFKLMLESHQDHEALLNYFNSEILITYMEDLNNLKREIYLSMKDLQPIYKSNCKLEKQYKSLYKLYQDLKNQNIKLNDGWDKYIDII
jgi:succinate dehydrogenase/fumarate reductase flavoprotein subunit